MNETYVCEETGLKVRVGEKVDPQRWATAQMNEWVDRNVTKTHTMHSYLRFERSWDYYKLGYKRDAVKIDKRLKGWRE